MFRFRLVKVLDYRRRREEQLEQELRQKRQHLEQEEPHLTSLQNDARTVEGQLSGSEGTMLSGDDVFRWRRHYQLLDQRIVAQRQAISEATEAMEASRQRLLQTRQATKTLEKLQEKAHARYAQEQEHREQWLIDEATILRSRYGH